MRREFDVLAEIPRPFDTPRKVPYARRCGRRLRAAPVFYAVLAVGLAALVPSPSSAHVGSPDLLPDDGMINEMHERHPGKIVFSNEPIPRSDPDETKLTTKANLEDKLFLRVFLDGSFENNFRKKGKRCDGDKRRLLRVLYDKHETVLEAKVMHDDDWNEWTAYSTLGEGPLNRAPGFSVELEDGLANENQVAFAFWTELAPNLKPGNNSLRFEAIADCNRGDDRQVVATGTLKMNVKAASQTALVKKNRPALPKSKMKNLHGEIRNAVQKKWSTKVYDVAVISDHWTIKRHPIHGRPTERFIEAWLVTDMSKKGCTLMSATLIQLANGNSYRKEFSTDIYTADEKPFPCG